MVATVAFAVLYQIPRKAILPVGLLGIVAELFLIAASEEHVGLVAVSFAASLTISLLGEGFARTLRMPVTIFSVPGIIVLVPGMNAYQTMKDFVTHQFMQGIAMGTETALIAGAIASGLVMAGVLARSVWRPRKNVD
ncbi:hypothetical protein BM613_02725 [Sulfoacidibacillus thermotolerans]|uniref:Threonine/Serine exporter ThrE domain-containing protein n=1 Tax=Sulfoacidibacillus thermotolerans TaxID=1765684 RepID=A0A2U3DBD7_SULT2|nr:hypothetical protein BM613_02725 [Sulfoacidibacillus thermotolerans]